MATKFKSKYRGQDIENILDRNAQNQLLFCDESEFPNVGKENVLYIVKTSHTAYIWVDGGYTKLKAAMPEISTINCGGAKEWQN